MTGFVRTLIRRLLAEDREGIVGGLSRNRHFEVFADAQGKVAHRAFRRLRGLIRDIHAAHPAKVALDRRAGALPVRLRIPLPGGVRTAYLSEDELQILLETPGLDGRLAP